MSTSSYITLPIETDPDTLSAEALSFLMTNLPGWLPQEGNLEVWMTEVFARIEGETRDVATRVPAEIFRFFGKSMLNIAPIDGAPATAQSTWVMRDTNGYTIPAGTLVAYQLSGTLQAYFSVTADVIVPPGSLQTADGEVLLRANVSGSAGNGFAAGPITLVNSLIFVDTVTTTTDTAGGVDPESDDDYLSRLRADLRLLTPRPILPNDFAVLARTIAGVDRSIAIDGYNPGDSTYNNERMVAVALADSAGQAVTDDIKNQVVTYLESLREVNFVVNAIDPSYTLIDVTATVAVVAGTDPASVQAAVVSALTSYLDPSNWNWSTVVRRNELITLISDVPGVDYLDTLETPPSDVILTSVAALVNVGTLAISTL